MLPLAYDRLLELQHSRNSLELVLDCFEEVDSSLSVFCLLCVSLECSSVIDSIIGILCVEGCASQSLRLILRHYFSILSYDVMIQY